MNKLEYCLAQIAHQVTETDELMGELIDMLASAAHSYQPPAEEYAYLGDELVGYVESITRLIAC